MDFIRNEVHTTTLSATLDAPSIQAIVEAAVREKAGVTAGQPGVTVAVGLNVVDAVVNATVQVQVDHTQVPPGPAEPAPAA